MSRIGGRGEAGKLFVTVEADTQKAKQDLDEVRSKLEQTGEAAEKSGDQTAGGLNRAGNAIEKQTEGVRKFTGAVTGIVGVFTAWLGVFALLSAAASTLTERLAATRDETRLFKEEAEAVELVLQRTAEQLEQYGTTTFSVEDLERARGEYLEIEKRIENINLQLESMTGLTSGPALSALQQQRDALAEQLKTTGMLIDREKERLDQAKENAEQEERAADAIERQGAGVDELRKRREQLIDDLSDRETRLARAAAREIASFEEQLRQSQDEDERRLLLDLIELRGQKFREQLKELEGEQIESAKRVGSAQREENDKTHRDRVRQIEEENRLVLAGLNEQADFIRAQNESDSGIVLQLQQMNESLRDIKGIIPGGNIG